MSAASTGLPGTAASAEAQQTELDATTTPRRSKKKKTAENTEMKLYNQRIIGGQADVTVRMLIVGSSAVGKTCLLSRLNDASGSIDRLKQTFFEPHEFFLEVGNGRVRAHVWDIGGIVEGLHESCQMPELYKDVQAVMLVFALDNYESYSKLPVWLDKVGRMSNCQKCQQQQQQQQQPSAEPVRKRQKLCAPCQHIDCVLIGNKCDLDDKRLISSREAEELARFYGMPYIETSVFTAVDNVQKAFYDLLLAVLKRSVSEKAEMTKRPRRQGGLNGLKALCCGCTCAGDRAGA